MTDITGSPLKSFKGSFAVLALMALSFCIGLYHLDYQSIWLDESTTLHVTRDLKTIMEYCRAFPEQHPLYYFLIYLLGFNTGIWKLRLFSLILGTASIIPLYYITRRIISTKAALVTCLLFTFSPFIIYYNQEGRMYSLLLFFSLVQVLFFVAWLDKSSRRNSIGYLVFSCLMVYTHFFGLFLIAGEMIFVLVFLRENDHFRAKVFLITLLSIGLLYSPWAVFLLKHLGGNAQSWKGSSNILFGFPYSIFRFAVGYGIVPLNVEVKRNLLTHIPWILFWSSLIVLVYAPVALVLARHHKQLTLRQRLIPVLAFAPILLMVIASLLKNMVSERYVIFAAPFFYMLVSLSYEQFSSRAKLLRISTVSIPLVLLLVGTSFYYFNPDFGKTNYKGVAHFLKKESSQGSLILCSPAFVKGPLDYYLKGSRRLRSLEAWRESPGGIEVWTLERMANESSTADLREIGYQEISEKVWPQENGLRLVEWSFSRK